MLEKLKSSTESISEENVGTGFDALVDMSGKFDANRARRLIESESPKNSLEPLEKNARELSQIANQLKVSLQKQNVDDVSSKIEEVKIEPATVNAKIIPVHPKTNIISDRYDAEERSRIDRLKVGLNMTAKRAEYARKQITA